MRHHGNFFHKVSSFSRSVCDDLSFDERSNLLFLRFFALLSLLFVLFTSKSASANIFETLSDVERERQTALRERDKVQTDIQTQNRKLVHLAKEAEASERAAKPVQRKTWQSLIYLERLKRSSRRASNTVPQLRSDAEHQIGYAASAAIGKQVATLQAIQSAEHHVVTFHQAIGARASISVRLAVLDGVVAAKTAERSQLLKGSKLDPQVEHDLQETSKRLATTLAPLPSHTANSDFHRRKGTLIRPVNAPVTYPFGPRQISDNFTIRVTGQTWNTRPGTPIRATAPGRVLFNEFFPGYGNLVIVDHGSGYRSLYAHLSTTSVKVGAEVGRGDVIATSGESGSLDGPKFYFELRDHGKPVDPEPWYLFN